MADLLHHLRLAVRSLSRSRGLATAVVLTMELGIGANAATFPGAPAASTR